MTLKLKRQSLNYGSDYQGRSLVVNEARPKEDRPRRDFGGGGNRSGGGSFRTNDRGGNRW